MDRAARSVLAFSVGFFLMVGFMLTAYASTATGPNGAITFQGDDCRDLLRGVVRSRAAAVPADPLPYESLECDRDTVDAGAVVKVLWRGLQDTSGTFDVTVGVVDEKNETGYLGFMGLAAIFGIGLLAGLQR